MSEFLSGSAFFGVGISLLGFEIGKYLNKKTKLAIVNPLLVAVLFVIGALLLLNVEYDAYYAGAKYLSWLLTPATACLAVPLYRRLEDLKKNWRGVVFGCVAGVLASLLTIYLVSLLFNLDHGEYATLLPRCVTTAIGMGVAEELGGNATVATTIIIATGIFGNMTAAGICRILRITDPVARGLAIGTASHAIGTAKALEMGETEGAMSGLAIAVAGLVTVVIAPYFAGFI